MTTKETISPEGKDLLEAVRHMKAGETGRVYSPEQILAIAARQSSKLTQVELAKLLDVIRVSFYSYG